MQRKYVLAYLLFSLFLFFLLSSCFAPSQRKLAELSGQGKYEELESKTATLHRRSIDAVSLYYRSLALQQLDRKEEAFHVLRLYFGFAKEDDEHLSDAHRMMCCLSLDPETTLSSGLWLEQRSLLDEQASRAYYQALLTVGDDAEATRIFALYLRGTITPFAYAQMVLTSGSDMQSLEDAFAPLALGEQLTLLQSVASGTVSQKRAMLLLSLATPLEQAFEGKAELVQVYRLLETLYGKADVRVQQRKYTTLAQNFR